MRRSVNAALLGLAFLLASPIVGQARGQPRGAAAGSGSQGSASPVSLQVSAGYQNIYRGSTWLPVRVTLHNRTSADVRGTLEVPQTAQAPSIGASPTFHGLYEAPVLLPAGGTKLATLYVPGSGTQGQVNVSFRQGGKTLATASAYPVGLDTSALLIGVMAGSPHDAAWIAPAIQQSVTTHVISLGAGTLDPVPEALATFDIIVLTNVDTSQLDGAQLGALDRYVRNGGSLLLVGGPSWQQTLRPLPAAFVPGRLEGTRTLPDLHGLLQLGLTSPASGRNKVPSARYSAQTAAVSVLSDAGGTVMASQADIPLVVRTTVGQGTVEYLAFDPALTPIQGWAGAPGLLRHLIASAAPLAISRTWSPQGFRGRFLRAFTSAALTGELSNLPPATLPLLALFAVLTLAYVLILGPANFVLLRWINRQHLAWITIPALALSYVGSAYGLTTHLKANAVLLNSIGMISLDDSAGPHPATFYLGLVAPLPGDYHLTYQTSALPAALPELSTTNGFFWRSASTLQDAPLGMRLQEGSRTEVTFLSMKRWAMRDVTLNTSVRIPGRVRSDLTIGAQGNLAGWIENGTNLDLLDPVIVAGTTVTHLPNIAAGRAVHAQAQPSVDSSSVDQPSLWSQLYGGPDLGGDGFGGFGGFRDCCDQFAFSQEKTLLDRVRNATGMLSQSQSLSNLGEVLLVAWSEQHLGTFTVDGSAPQRRDLNLIVMPLSVHFPARGSFRLLTGTLGAHVVDMVPQAPQSSCCGFFDRNTQQLSIGQGGSVTFEFDTGDAGGRASGAEGVRVQRSLRFQQLTISVNSQANGLNTGLVYDWRAQRWVSIDLSGGSADLASPNRFVSSHGQIMLKLQATAGSGDITIDDPYQSVQLSGAGAVS